jgi:preprotein translocase subunit SecE
MLRVRVLPGLFDLRQGVFMKKVIRFVEESIAELRKVLWPSRDEVIASTKVVIVSMIIISALLGLIDLLLYMGLDFLF